MEALIFDDGLALDALIDEIDGWLDAAELTNEELLVKIEYIKEAIQEARVSAYKEGDEVTTIFIENPNFSVDGSANTKGWEKAEGYNNTFKGGTSGVIEAWDASFNIYQDLKGLQNGAYELEIQAYYRTNNSAEAYASWVKEDGQNRGDNIVESFLYADENEAPFVNIMAWGLAEDGDGAWTGPHDDGLMRPNDVTSANWAFNYEVRCKGFFRDESSDQANDAYLNDTTEIRGKLFAESAAMLRQESDLANLIVIDEECLNAPGSENDWRTITVDGTTYFYPHARVAARLRFEAGFYDNAMVVKVGEDGKLRLGFCNKAHKLNDWAATSNYELWYFGTNSSKQPNHDVDAIHTVSVKAEKNNQYYDLLGRKVNVPTAKGIYIINGKKVLVK